MDKLRKMHGLWPARRWGFASTCSTWSRWSSSSASRWSSSSSDMGSKRWQRLRAGWLGQDAGAEGVSSVSSQSSAAAVSGASNSPSPKRSGARVRKGWRSPVSYSLSLRDGGVVLRSPSHMQTATRASLGSPPAADLEKLCQTWDRTNDQQGTSQPLETQERKRHINIHKFFRRLPGSPDRVARGQKFMCCVRNPRNINIFVRVPGRECTPRPPLFLAIMAPPSPT